MASGAVAALRADLSTAVLRTVHAHEVAAAAADLAGRAPWVGRAEGRLALAAWLDGDGVFADVVEGRASLTDRGPNAPADLDGLVGL